MVRVEVRVRVTVSVMSLVNVRIQAPNVDTATHNWNDTFNE